MSHYLLTFGFKVPSGPNDCSLLSGLSDKMLFSPVALALLFEVGLQSSVSQLALGLTQV